MMANAEGNCEETVKVKSQGNPDYPSTERWMKWKKGSKAD